MSGTDVFALRNPGKIYRNTGSVELIELALQRREGVLTADGALAVETGHHTGRSAADKFTVRDDKTESTIWWDNNAAMSPEHFDALYQDFLAHAEGRDLFVQELHAGADPAHRLTARIYTELAWHALFIRYLLRRPEAAELEGFEARETARRVAGHSPDDIDHTVFCLVV